MSKQKYETLEEFWPFYVGQHQKPATRQLHFVGTSLMIVFLATTLLRRQPRWLAATLVAPYLFAWIGHWFVEKNQPATFKYPLKSLLSDFKMYGLMWQGRMEAEVARCTEDQSVQVQ